MGSRSPVVATTYDCDRVAGVRGEDQFKAGVLPTKCQTLQIGCKNRLERLFSFHSEDTPRSQKYDPQRNPNTFCLGSGSDSKRSATVVLASAACAFRSSRY